jgi:hypothetical protein
MEVSFNVMGYGMVLSVIIETPASVYVLTGILVSL